MISSTQSNILVKEKFENYATLYQWFIAIFSKELSDDQLHLYFQGQGAPFIEEVCFLTHKNEDEQASILNIFNTAIAGIKLLESPTLEMAADFTYLFLEHGHVSAVPYASVYEKENPMFYQEPHKRMVNYLKQSNLSISDYFLEPADHLSVMLSYLVYLCQSSSKENTDKEFFFHINNFVKKELLTWVPIWNAHCQSQKDNLVSPFYPLMASLLLSLLETHKSSCEGF